jgi:hypothetical protein
MTEIRYYKGKFKVEILLKSKGNWLVRSLEGVPQQFTTCPRLLWRKPRFHPLEV